MLSSLGDAGHTQRVLHTPAYITKAETDYSHCFFVVLNVEAARRQIYTHREKSIRRKKCDSAIGSI